MRFLHLSLQNLISFSFICFIFTFIFFIWPNNKWRFVSMSEIGLRQRIIASITLLATILISILPMPLSPYWNGTFKVFADKQQYDRMGDALLQGRLYIDNGDIDPALEAMENPYVRADRERLGVKYNWDEAYYNRHYYMYFGVVPTLLLFIPYKLITGTALLTYQATQIFATLTIIGLYYLFYILCRKYFTTFPFILYLLLSSAFGILSIGYSISAPALYCTAIVSAVCLMVWSIICFIKGVWLQKEREISIWCLFVGGLLGSLAFGCRPPVALANLLIIAVVLQISKNDILTYFEKAKMIAYLLLPYVIVGIALMLYNYARFDNVFEFGQSYQLTLADQHNYGSFFSRFDLKRLFSGIIENFYGLNSLSAEFPFIFFNGAFINFPILLLSSRMFSNNISKSLQTKKLYTLSLLLFFLPFLITFFDVYWSPFLLERYRLDFYYLLCIVSFIGIATWLEQVSVNKRMVLICGVTVLSFSVFIVEFLFFCIPFDGNYTFYYSEVLNEIYKGLRFGL